MLKKLLLCFALLCAMMGSAFAAVDLNTADQAALNSLKGVGPAKAKAILDERSKNGPFKDWADFQKRVKGFADKSTSALSEGGATINGQSKQGAGEKKASASASAASAASTASAASAASAPASASAKAGASAAASAPAKASAPASATKAASASAASAAASKK
ncbi:helix-hairpin-helix domain-containing protein [Massilia sp. W12]|uniref:ComEA family DNA-binding protein n=1 Tax=Massilia sp. W12 TaxID=3126507 RepID=UPI0030CF0FA0